MIIKKFKLIFLIITILVMMSGCTTNAKNLSHIHHLDNAANLLMLISDNEVGIVNKCNLTSAQAMGMLQPLHALIDEEIKIQTDKVHEDQMMNCEKSCHCGVYSDIISNEDIKKKLYDEAKLIPRKKLIECANKSAKWLCDSTLLKKLKSEIEPVNNGL